MNKSVLMPIAALLMAGAAGYAGAAAIGVTWEGGVYSIDEAAGTASLIGASGFQTINSLATNSAGALYAGIGYPLTPQTQHQLITIDSATGAGAVAANLNLSTFGEFYSVRALAFSSADVLFAIVDESTTSSRIGLDALYTINVSTGAMTRIGGTGLWGLQGLDFASNGALYGWDVANASGADGLGLVTIDIGTGAVTDVNAGVGGNLSVQTLSFSLDGSQLYGAGQSGLYSVNVATGARTQIGGGWNYDMRGMEPVMSQSVPEPATAVLLGLGLAGLAASRRRK